MNYTSDDMIFVPQSLTEIAAECRAIVLAAEKDLGKLPRASYLDLVAEE